MKKVFAILAIAGAIVACNSKSDKKADETKDSTTKMMDTTSKMMDTTSKMADTTKPKM